MVSNLSYEKQMMLLKKQLKKAKDVARPTFKKPIPPPYVAAWEKAGLTAYTNDFGTYFLREVYYDKSMIHGHFTLAEYFTAKQKIQEAQVIHPLVSDQELVFFDTETTGLKGVGTQIFLMGELHEEEEGFRLKQYVQADPAHEAAMLFATSMWRESTPIVTYNGKSFDWPQLETRFTLHRQQLPPLKKRAHIDLLHTTRRLWKKDMTSMKLTTIEEDKLGFTRDNDIPGFLAPIIYADAVRSGVPDQLMAVLQHNEWDLLSLITLYTQSVYLVLEEAKDNVITHTNVGKWYADLKDHERSQAILQRVTTNTAYQDTYDAYFYLAWQYKKNKQPQQAYEAFQQALPQLAEVQQLQAYEELAKLSEHTYKDYEKALEYCNEAIQCIMMSTRLKNPTRANKLMAWQKRQRRLGTKIAQQTKIN